MKKIIQFLQLNYISIFLVINGTLFIISSILNSTPFKNSKCSLFVFPEGNRHILLLIGMSFICFPSGIIIKNISSKLPQWMKSITVKTIVAIITSSILFYLTFLGGNRHFDGYNESVLVDAAWRFINHQNPYIDFQTVFPVGFLITLKCALLSFGSAWNSFTLLNSLFLFVSWWWIYILLRNNETSFIETVLLTSATLSLSVTMLSFWWYNPTTIIIGFLYFLSALNLLNGKCSLLIKFSYGCSLALLALFKPTVGMFMIPLVSLSLLLSRRCTAYLIVVSFLAFLTDLILLHTNGFSISTVLYGYSASSQKSFPNKFFVGVILPEKIAQLYQFCIYLIPLLIEFQKFDGFKRFNRYNKSKVILLLSTLVAGFYMWGTSREIAAVSFPLIFFPLYLLLLGNKLPSKNTFHARHLTYSILIWSILTGSVLGLIRYRIQLVGPYFDSNIQQISGPNRFFKGFYASSSFNEILNEINVALNNDKSKKVFFGQRLEFAYAAFQLHSPENMPLCLFTENDTQSPQKKENVVANFQQHNFDICIFRKEKVATAFKPILGELYTMDSSFASLSVFYKK